MCKTPRKTQNMFQNVDFEGTPHLDFEAIGPAEFSEEKLELDKVFRSLQDYLGTMPFSEKIRVSSSWEALRQTLESIPGR